MTTKPRRSIAQRAFDIADIAGQGRALPPVADRPRCGARLRGPRAGRTCQRTCMPDPDRPGELLPRCKQHGGAAMLGSRRWIEARRADGTWAEIVRRKAEAMRVRRHNKLQQKAYAETGYLDVEAYAKFARATSKPLGFIDWDAHERIAEQVKRGGCGKNVR